MNGTGSSARIETLFDVSGLSVVVTGGASGIGLGFARAMAENGAQVTLFDIDRDALDAACTALGPDAVGVEVDATDAAALDRGFAQVAEARGVDVVFANAGISGGPGFVTPDGERLGSRAFEALDPALLDRVLSVNIGATFRTMQAAIPHLKARGGGRIIVTSSISATHTELLVGAPYVASKGGVGMLVKQAARELARYGILVNAISPGPVITNIGGGRLQDDASRAPFERAAPLGRIARPQDLYGAALFLASPASSHVTGAEIIIDGGACLGPDRPV
ncbi:SDR family NAD(P)-dependent oxidoreductase [Mesobacterium pallidum]|uniref:SDR family NAD(P)-dependent oxidoreductase n=1 Tax=Mesobacterium pallidum TaxID=2872037 RepID=UPI001EE398E8|nr:SDR family NAD(P)-dependent oxidoreductase [Mesobacterium pallidum]